MPNDPKGPQSPDQLQSGIHGRVEGVTRIGPRAVLLGVLIAAALLGGILYGLTAGGNKNQQVAQQAPPIPVAPPQPSTGPHFGEDVPLVPTQAPETPPPAVLLPPSPPPLQQVTPQPTVPPNSGPSTPSAEELAEAKRAEEEEKRREAEEAEREAELKRANLAPIFASVAGGGGGGFSGSGGGAAGTSGAGSVGGAPNYTNGGGGTQVAQAGGAGGVGGGGGVGGAGGGAGGIGGGGAGGIGGGGGVGGPGTAGGGAAAPAPTINPAYSFLSGPTGNYSGTAYSIGARNGPSHNDLPASRYAPQTVFQLMAGSVMPAILITSIDSEQAGLVTAQIRENVYDTKSGRFLLIPAGSRLIGTYQSGVKYGQSRVEVAWQRLIFPDTSSIDLINMTGSDVQGFAGMGGKVDNHLGTLFFGTFLTSVLTAAIALSTPQTANVVSTSAGTVSVPSQGQVAAQGVGQNLTNTAQQLIQRDLNLPPIIYVPKGYPFLVVVDRDMVFPGPYGPYVDPGL